MAVWMISAAGAGGFDFSHSEADPAKPLSRLGRTQPHVEPLAVDLPHLLIVLPRPRWRVRRFAFFRATSGKGMPSSRHRAAFRPRAGLVARRSRCAESTVRPACQAGDRRL